MRSLETSSEVNETLGRFFAEQDIYHIDHYLKEGDVQNLLVLRFANRFTWALMGSKLPVITCRCDSRKVGIEGRWAYYDGVGQLRDMVQNHLMQLLCLVAMEPPNSLEAEIIRDEKVKIVKPYEGPVDRATVKSTLCVASTARVSSMGRPSRGISRRVAVSTSDTGTFVAIKAYVDNWRWSGVPFYLRTGKRMPDKVTEIIIQYKACLTIFSVRARSAEPTG